MDRRQLLKLMAMAGAGLAVSDRDLGAQSGQGPFIKVRGSWSVDDSKNVMLTSEEAAQLGLDALGKELKGARAAVLNFGRDFLMSLDDFGKMSSARSGIAWNILVLDANGKFRFVSLSRANELDQSPPSDPGRTLFEGFRKKQTRLFHVKSKRDLETLLSSSREMVNAVVDPNDDRTVLPMCEMARRLAGGRIRAEDVTNSSSLTMTRTLQDTLEQAKRYDSWSSPHLRKKIEESLVQVPEPVVNVNYTTFGQDKPGLDATADSPAGSWDIQVLSGPVIDVAVGAYLEDLLNSSFVEGMIDRMILTEPLKNVPVTALLSESNILKKRDAQRQRLATQLLVLQP